MAEQYLSAFVVEEADLRARAGSGTAKPLLRPFPVLAPHEELPRLRDELARPGPASRPGRRQVRAAAPH